MTLMVGLSIADILLMEKIIDNHMRDNNIKNINDIDEKIIQQKYDEIIRNEMWRNPKEFPSIKCPQCRMVSYNENDIKHKFCGNCHEWHEFMKVDK
jgi:hypothetical protein